MNFDIDRALVDKANSGDSRAFEMLVIKYQRKVGRIISRFIKDENAIEDITQESFIKAFKSLANFRGDSAFYTWLYRIAINTAKNYLLANAKNNNLLVKQLDENGNLKDIVDFLPDFNTPETELLNKEILNVINNSIDSLQESLKQVIILREIEGLSYEDISNILGCPVGTVRSRIFRAREIISKQLQALLDNSNDT